MARQTAQPPPEPALCLAIPREEAHRKIAERIERGTELKTRPIRDEQTFREVQQEYWTWGEYNEEMLRRVFTSPKIAAEYSPSAGIAILGDTTFAGEIRDLHESIDHDLRRLSSINERLELIPLSPDIAAGQVASKRTTADVASDRVFVVHGHDEAVRETVARFISTLGLTPVILHEQPSQGRTIVEKLEHHGDVGYAVVLLTPDDVGGSSPGDLKPRARQNVVLELGYFVGRLGRKHVCAVHRGNLELPSDYVGVLYVPFDDGGGWRLQVAKELKAAGFSVDLNNAL